MELLITGIKDGIVKFVEGKEQEVEVEYLKNRISQIDTEINNLRNTNLSAIEGLVESKNSAIKEEANKLVEAKHKLELEYKENIEAIGVKFEEQLEILNQNKVEDEAKISILSNERVKLKAILNGVSGVDLLMDKSRVINESGTNIEEVDLECVADNSLNLVEQKEVVIAEEELMGEPVIENIPQPQQVITSTEPIVEKPKLKF